ncbi:MAG: sulfite exporter TauE/SafE family protein [Bacteroidetes bacterium]|nr:sulfite exporter TauE/SafE family protein [Bacteroidota bacterium]
MQEWLFVLLSGYGIGLFGSFHCIGMCGPIALSLPIHQFQQAEKLVSVLLYNIGRSISYAIFGMLFGLIGSTFTFFKIQQFLSIFSGILLLLLFLNQRYGKVNFSIFYRFTSKIKNQLGVYLKSEKSVLSYLFIGILNGFLPCGLVYVAIAAAIATGSVFKSSLLMFGFGLGTIPVMVLLMYFGKFLSQNIRSKINAVTPYLIMGMAILLIIRGMNLGIPYISPSLIDETVNCCHR